jgi:hypothetical protein
MKFLIASYLEQLTAIPGDLALYAIRNWTRQGGEQAKWFPSWAELVELIEDALHDRELMMEALK